MTEKASAESRNAGRHRRSSIERSIRLLTGLVLFGYAASHLLSHACGLFLLDTMDRLGRGILLAPWRTEIGRGLLIGSLFVHGGLGIVAFVRRRHLIMPRIEAVQLALGLLIPLLLIPHVTNVRLGSALYGLDDSYFRILYQYWITSPASGLSRQFALMTILWTHGSIGLHMWLRFRPWYRRWSGGLLALAVAVPVLAMLGIMNGGWNTAMRATLEPGFSALHGPPSPGTSDASHRADLEALWKEMQLGYLALVLAALAYRAVRQGVGRRFGGITIVYPGVSVAVPRGFSILEASRFAGVPHASMCGGRARCSTCRIRILRGLDDLPAPNGLERATLSRINAPAEVRLACQTHPVADVSIVPLVPPASLGSDSRIAFEQGVEHVVTALAVDLRDSTRIAAGRLPFDTLYLINRYVSCVSAAIEAQGGYVTSVAGDGVMSVFGFDGNAAAGATRAIAAALGIWDALEALENELAEDLRAPLKFGMGLHTGVAVIGAIALSGRNSLQFLGDTGNVASRLEGFTKDRGCVLLASAQVFEVSGLVIPAEASSAIVPVRGREDRVLSAIGFTHRSQLAGILRDRTSRQSGTSPGRGPWLAFGGAPQAPT